MTFHSAIALSDVQGDLGSCSVDDNGQEGTAAIPVEIKAVDATPNSFHVPNGDVIALRSTGLSEPLVGDSTSGFVPSVCEALGAAPNTTASGYIIVNGFRTPNNPSGDFGELGQLQLYSPRWQAKGMGLDFPNLNVTTCLATGVVHAQIKTQTGSIDEPAICTLSFA